MAYAVQNPIEAEPMLDNERVPSVRVGDRAPDRGGLELQRGADGITRVYVL